MRCFIVYCHPSEDSFTARVRDQFIKGLELAGHSYEISDLYKMEFKTDMSEQEYLRESYYEANGELEEDVMAEQEKIQGCDTIVFIYPVFWTEAPAKLVGWFDRVWSYGFAYGEKPIMKVLDKAIFIVTAGHSLEYLNESKQAQAMGTVMLGDRISYRAKEKQMIFLPQMSRLDVELRESNAATYLDQIWRMAVDLK
ncbi:NAD(P)H-dependent oxidoreductase [Anaeromicropila populeti]|uniref:NAD(P)H dehydrogenase (Quinone) n=1 Tax=Anaeromicropila populeti TaxID=37658 RepID=A0A1I6IWA8_9FIRM|nr:NAD(P)H-dependent oxidoreductase [Anaeromicropila populeti]SFR70959.1 NAD(P)H dehydrogenase (quinone) [Anaeromicropila populeti]